MAQQPLVRLLLFLYLTSILMVVLFSNIIQNHAEIKPPPAMIWTKTILSQYQDGDSSDDLSVCPQKRRLRALDEYCVLHPEDKWRPEHKAIAGANKDPTSIVVDENHKIMLCNNAKAAGSMLRTLFFVASTPKNTKKGGKTKFNWHSNKEMRTYGIRHLADYPPLERARIVDSYIKIINVRHPFDRLYSAYRDKFIKSSLGYGSRRFLDYVIANFRAENETKNVTDAPQGKRKMSLEEFVLGVLDKSSPYNVHWRSYADHCHPCVIKYDHIIKTETMTENADVLLRILASTFPNRTLDVPIMHSREATSIARRQSKNQTSMYLQHFAELDSVTLNKLDNALAEDMTLFGYSFNKTTYKASCGYSGDDTCC